MKLTEKERQARRDLIRQRHLMLAKEGKVDNLLARLDIELPEIDEEFETQEPDLEIGLDMETDDEEPAVSWCRVGMEVGSEIRG